MLNWIEIAALSISVITVFYFVYRNMMMKRNFRILAEMHLQIMADVAMVDKKNKELYQEIENLRLKDSDGFLKFVSESREWAFQYIEQVQSALSEFSSEVEPILEWCNTYGIAIDEVHSEQVKKISLAYNKLKEVLPKDNETPNN